MAFAYALPALKAERNEFGAIRNGIFIWVIWPLAALFAVFYAGMRRFGDNPIERIVATPDDEGYWLIARDGGVIPFGNANQYSLKDGRGSIITRVECADIVVRPDTGRIQTASDVPNITEPPLPEPLNAPIADVVTTNSGNGYWMVGQDGAVYARGDAEFFGSICGHPADYRIRWKSKYWKSAPIAREFAPKKAETPATADA